MSDIDSSELKPQKHQRPRGTGCVYQHWTQDPSDPQKKILRSANWWIQYYRNGQVYRQSAGTSKKREAEALLRKKLAEIATHNFVEPRFEKTLVKELYDDLKRDYENNDHKSLDDAEARWKLHLSPVFGDLRAANVNNEDLQKYVNQRKMEGAANATINRELALLKRAFSLGLEARKVFGSPKFPHLEERNVRKGFVEDAQYAKLASACTKRGLWLRAMFEVGINFGWRVSELQGLRVRQIDLAARTIRLEPGETKNDEARTAVMPSLVYALIQQCVVGKSPDDFVFTRENGQPIKDFRDAWSKATTEAGVPDLLFHDLRRTAVRNMVRRGIPERVAMMISGHKTRSIFDRYNIVSEGDLQEAARKMERIDFSSTSGQVERIPQQVAKASNVN